MTTAEQFKELYSSSHASRFVTWEEITKRVNPRSNSCLDIKLGTMISFPVKDKLYYGFVEKIMTEPNIKDPNKKEEIIMLRMMNSQGGFISDAAHIESGAIYRIKNGNRIFNIGPPVKELLDYFHEEEKKRKDEKRRRSKIKRITVGEYEDMKSDIENLKKMVRQLKFGK